MNDALTAVLQIVTALGGVAGIGAVMKVGSDRRTSKAKALRDDAVATKAVVDTALGMLTPLRKQVDDLAADLAKSRQEAVALRDDVRGLHEWINDLITALENAGLPVPPRPTPPLSAPSASDGPRRRRNHRSEPPS